MLQTVKGEGAVDVIRFPGTLDAFHMMRLKSHLTRLLNRHPKILFLDLAQTQRVELAGLGMLIDRVKRLGNGHGVVRFSNVSPTVHRTLARAGVNELLFS